MHFAPNDTPTVLDSDSKHPHPEIEKRLQAIYALHTKKMDFRLGDGPYGDLLNALGNPHLKIPPVIHLAGTNGKGSTLAFIKSLCQARGLRVHAYTSPHLMQFNERIMVADCDVDDETLLHYLHDVDRANNNAAVSFFEYTTALAFKIFADHPADICLLETGLGGRLDCTNIVENPIATIITAIGYDHMDWLGQDIETIAMEKSGIMKPGVPCFIAPQKYDINHVFEHRAKEIGCELHYVERITDLPNLGLIGDHQKDNASTAVSVVSAIIAERNGVAKIQKTQQNQALETTYWPARMEQVSTSPDIWFDCGHNVDGAEAIAHQLATWKQAEPDRPIYMVLGLPADKNPNDFMESIWPHIDGLTCVDLVNARNPQTAQDLAMRLSPPLSPSSISSSSFASSAPLVSAHSSVQSDSCPTSASMSLSSSLSPPEPPSPSLSPSSPSPSSSLTVFPQIQCVNTLVQAIENVMCKHENENEHEHEHECKSGFVDDRGEGGEQEEEKNAKLKSNPNARILIAGSLYLYEQVKKKLEGL